MTLFKKLIKYLRFYGGKYHCIVCNRPVRSYFKFSECIESSAKKFGFSYDFKRVESLNYNHCNCPFCLSSDRERLYVLFLINHFSVEHQKIELLDFAPNHFFSNRLKGIPLISYTSADYFREDVDLKLDACNMESVKSNTYDVVLFSHVLEHVTHPLDALKEIYRIIKPGGFAIIMVPLFLDVKETVEDPNHTTVEERWRYYGQGDHLRLYSKLDFINQVVSAGFQIEQLTINDFDSTLISVNAIAENSVLYKCNKLK